MTIPVTPPMALAFLFVGLPEGLYKLIKFEWLFATTRFPFCVNAKPHGFNKLGSTKAASFGAFSTNLITLKCALWWCDEEEDEEDDEEEDEKEEEEEEDDDEEDDDDDDEYASAESIGLTANKAVMP